MCLEDKYNPKAHIVVATLGSLLNKINAPRSQVDLTSLKIFILDEADSFFLEDDRRSELKQFDKILNKLKQRV
jgi:superfamily II DNA/RNA helicase